MNQSFNLTNKIKLLNSNLIHFGMSYHLGLNILDGSFDTSDKCCKGGLYFTDIQYAHKHYRPLKHAFVGEISFESDQPIVVLRDGELYKTDKINLVTIVPISELVIDYLDGTLTRSEYIDFFKRINIIRCFARIPKEKRTDPIERLLTIVSARLQSLCELQKVTKSKAFWTSIDSTLTSTIIVPHIGNVFLWLSSFEFSNRCHKNNSSDIQDLRTRSLELIHEILVNVLNDDVLDIGKDLSCARGSIFVGIRRVNNNELTRVVVKAIKDLFAGTGTRPFEEMFKKSMTFVDFAWFCEQDVHVPDGLMTTIPLLINDHLLHETVFDHLFNRFNLLIQCQLRTSRELSRDLSINETIVQLVLSFLQGTIPLKTKIYCDVKAFITCMFRVCPKRVDLRIVEVLKSTVRIFFQSLKKLPRYVNSLCCKLFELKSPSQEMLDRKRLGCEVYRVANYVRMLLFSWTYCKMSDKIKYEKNLFLILDNLKQVKGYDDAMMHRFIKQFYILDMWTDVKIDFLTN